MLALVPLVYAVKEAAAHGIDEAVVIAAVVGIAFGVAFVRRQKRIADPMIDLQLFANPAFSTAVFANFLSVFALAGVLFFGSQYLQLVLGNSPLEAGLLLLPGTAASIATSLLAAYLVRVYLPATVLSAGLAAAGLGAALLFGLRVDSGPALFIAGFVLVGGGAGVALTLTSDLVVGAVRPERAGAASAVSETAYELGIALGVALLGTVVMSYFRRGLELDGLATESAAAARETLGGAATVADALPADIGSALTTSANEAFVTGMHAASLVTATLMVATAVVVFVRLRPTAAPATPPAPAD